MLYNPTTRTYECPTTIHCFFRKHTRRLDLLGFCRSTRPLSFYRSTVCGVGTVYGVPSSGFYQHLMLTSKTLGGGENWTGATVSAIIIRESFTYVLNADLHCWLEPAHIAIHGTPSVSKAVQALRQQHRHRQAQPHHLRPCPRERLTQVSRLSLKPLAKSTSGAQLITQSSRTPLM